jgi:hypothetical protein
MELALKSFPVSLGRNVLEYHAPPYTSSDGPDAWLVCHSLYHIRHRIGRDCCTHDTQFETRSSVKKKHIHICIYIHIFVMWFI